MQNTKLTVKMRTVIMQNFHVVSQKTTRKVLELHLIILKIQKFIHFLSVTRDSSMLEGTISGTSNDGFHCCFTGHQPQQQNEFH